MSDGVHAELALKPNERCPLGRVVADYAVQQFVPAGTDTPPQVVLDADSVGTDGGGTAGEGVAVDESALRAVEETKETVICRLVDPDGDDTTPPRDRGGQRGWSCPRCSTPCPTAGFDFLPLRPYDRSVTGEWLRLAFAAVDESTLRACLRRLDDAGRAVSLETLRAEPDEEADGRRTVLVDLSDLTPRQRETAALAVRQGYFESDGVSAAELADQLDVAKATVSEHLRAVRAKVGRQLFPEENGG